MLVPLETKGWGGCRLGWSHSSRVTDVSSRVTDASQLRDGRHPDEIDRRQLSRTFTETRSHGSRTCRRPPPAHRPSETSSPTVVDLPTPPLFRRSTRNEGPIDGRLRRALPETPVDTPLGRRYPRWRLRRVPPTGRVTPPLCSTSFSLSDTYVHRTDTNGERLTSGMGLPPETELVASVIRWESFLTDVFVCFGCINWN